MLKLLNILCIDVKKIAVLGKDSKFIIAMEG
jgi:hypothetical protein